MRISNTAERLKYLMNERNWKQVDILKKLQPICKKYNTNVYKSHISQWVNGKNEPNNLYIALLAESLNVNEAWLMGYEVPMLDVKVDNIDTGELLAIVSKDEKVVEYIRKIVTLSEDKRQLVYNIIDSYVS